ncbi:uncharacterized protein LOC101211448 [Cucumis sativus]|uniref:DUF7963 domain-containing protein n=1 Tax=Cucumis sativus TaxID=3659 RepID=A0A0A0L722_CUCSA|nr:uncharacterized protein LOC101211448 [Cucumis sativus]KGN55921.1 hypothetical protein Csa_011669 [Cucumis sativus]
MSPSLSSLSFAVFHIPLFLSSFTPTNPFLHFLQFLLCRSLSETSSLPPSMADSDDPAAVAAQAVHRRYEGLLMVRTKALKGKGAWYWSHLEPLLLKNSDTGFPKAVKLRCSLCDAVFSASNPSRTASEHLKRGTCPNFYSPSKTPLLSVSPVSRKRNTADSDGGDSFYDISPLTVVDPSGVYGGSFSPFQPHQQQPLLVLSGGKEDLGALAMLENSVKKLRTPRTSPGVSLNKDQIDSALDFLTDWVFESSGSVSISSLEHPKFKAFLNQVGLPSISSKDFATVRLNSKYEMAKADVHLKISEAMFFQIASSGWRPQNQEDTTMVHIALNLPNGTSLYRKTLIIDSSVPCRFVEEVLWDTVLDVCGNIKEKCVGIVADKFMSKALKSLENQHQWLVNLPCQFQAFNSLVKDFIRNLPLFKTVAENCKRVAHFFNFESHIRTIFHKYLLQECGHTCLITLSTAESEEIGATTLFQMVDNMLESAPAIQLAWLDEAFKTTVIEDPIAREVSHLVGSSEFWNEVEAVHCLIKLVKDMAQEIEIEKPLVGQCLPMWEELREKVKDWCKKFHISEESLEKIVSKRFEKNYHPAWAAAFVLDPLYLIRDNTGKYLPPFKRLTTEQEKDVDRLITRLVAKEEAHIVLMELMKWRTEGLDQVYARAVQMKEKDPITGKLRTANPQSSRLVWETYLTEFNSLRKVAVRLIFLHATSCGFKSNGKFERMVCSSYRSSRATTESIKKLVFISAHSKLEKRNLCSNSNENRGSGDDIELFAAVNSEDDLPSEADGSSSL